MSDDILLAPLTDTKKSVSSSVADTDYEDQNSSVNLAFSNDSVRTRSYDVRLENKKYNMTRVNSSYIPAKSLSRYGNAFLSMVPYRRITTSKTEMPIDTIGCLTNATFSWVFKYRISKNMLEKKNNLPFKNNPTDEKFLLPKGMYRDSCEVNGRRLYGIYKYDFTTHGHAGCSMFRVARKFCSTRIIISSIIYSIALLIGLMGPVLFLKLSIDPNKDSISNNDIFESRKLHRIAYSSGIFLSYFTWKFLKMICSWINLRTAIRLRTACISSLYKKSMKSSIAYPIAPHQILSFTNEESDIIMNMIESGSLIFGNILGVVWCCISALILLLGPGMYPLCCVCLMFVIVYMLSKISAQYTRKAIHYASKKLTIVEDLCSNFKNTIVLKFERIVLKNFTRTLEKQYTNLVWAEVYSSKYTGSIISAILMGALYLIWCASDIITETDDVLILLIVYSFFFRNFFIEFCDCIQSLNYGAECLEKLKNSYSMTESNRQKMRPRNNIIMIQIDDAQFQWDTVTTKTSKSKGKSKNIESNNNFILNVKEFVVPRHQCIGVTGDKNMGKSTLLYSILGHTNLIKGSIDGKFRQRGTSIFFPKIPFLHPGSIKSNIIMESDFDGKLYYHSLSVVKLNEDVCATPGADELPVGELELTSSQIERIMIARALYSNRDVIVMDEPFSQLMYSDSDREILDNVLDYLKSSEKTIVLATQDSFILSRCDKIYFLNEEGIYRDGTHTELLTIPLYKQMLDNSTADRRSVGIRDSIDESNLNRISSIKYLYRKNSRNQSIRNSSMPAYRPVYTISDENLLDPAVTTTFSFTTIINIIFQSVLFLGNYISYFIFPCGMIFIVDRMYVEEWLAMISIGGIIIAFVLDFISRLHIAYSAKFKSQSYQKKLFEVLLKTPLSFLYNFNSSDIIYFFTINVFHDFKAYYIVVQHSAAIIVSSFGLIYANYWTSIVIFVILIAVTVYVLFFKLTLKHFHSHELDTQRKMYNLVKSNIVGRAVIQSIDRINEFSKQFFELIEENSTAIFIRKSVIYNISFFIYSMCALGLWSVCLIVILAPNSTLSYMQGPYNYVLAIFSYFIFSYSLHELFTKGFCEIFLSQHTITKLSKFEQKIISNKLSDSSQTETINDLHKGLPILFTDVKCRLTTTKPELEISTLSVQSGEKVLISGRGAQLIVPLMKRIVTPLQGRIQIGNTNISQLTKESLLNILEIIPYNPRINDVTVRTFITASLKIKIDDEEKEIRNHLESLNIIDIINRDVRKLNQPLSNLTREIRQLLCIVRCIMVKPKIIIIEKPNPSIMNIINRYLQTVFESTTVLFIGYNNEEFNVNRVIHLHTNV